MVHQGPPQPRARYLRVAEVPSLRLQLTRPSGCVPVPDRNTWMLRNCSIPILGAAELPCGVIGVPLLPVVPLVSQSRRLTELLCTCCRVHWWRSCACARLCQIGNRSCGSSRSMGRQPAEGVAAASRASARHLSPVEQCLPTGSTFGWLAATAPSHRLHCHQWRRRRARTRVAWARPIVHCQTHQAHRARPRSWC